MRKKDPRWVLGLPGGLHAGEGLRAPTLASLGLGQSLQRPDLSFPPKMGTHRVVRSWKGRPYTFTHDDTPTSAWKPKTRRGDQVGPTTSLLPHFHRSERAGR